MKKPAAFLVMLLVGHLAYGITFTVFGFELGQPIVLPECTTSLIGTQTLYDLFQNKTCLEQKTMTGNISQRLLRFSKEDWPSYIASEGVLVMENGPNLIGIQFGTGGIIDQTFILTDLRAKYGKPTSLIKTVAQNSFGATYEVIHARWKFPGLLVTFDGALGSIDEGSVIIDTSEAVQIKAAWASEVSRGKTL